MKKQLLTSVAGPYLDRPALLRACPAPWWNQQRVFVVTRGCMQRNSTGVGVMRLVSSFLVVMLGLTPQPGVAGSDSIELSRATTVQAPVDLDLALSTLDGSKIMLSDFKAKVTVVNFWASWCFPCRYEMPRLEALHERFSDRGLAVVAIAVDDGMPPARAFRDKGGFSLPMLFDATGVSKRAFHVDGVPETYVVDADGRLLPFEDPRTHETSVRINDPTVWEGEEIVEFLIDALAR